MTFSGTPKAPTKKKYHRRSSKYPRWVQQIIENGADSDPLRQLLDVITGLDSRENIDHLEPYGVFLLPSASKAEKVWFERDGEKIIAAKFPGKEIMFVGYEWFSFKLPGGVYTPDYFYRFTDGSWLIVEIKESVYAFEYKHSREKMRIAATLNPWHTFMWAVGDSKGWKTEIIPADPGWLHTFYMGGNDES